jgi:hypothetical protein
MMNEANGRDQDWHVGMALQALGGNSLSAAMAGFEDAGLVSGTFRYSRD